VNSAHLTTALNDGDLMNRQPRLLLQSMQAGEDVEGPIVGYNLWAKQKKHFTTIFLSQNT